MGHISYGYLIEDSVAAHVFTSLRICDRNLTLNALEICLRPVFLPFRFKFSILDFALKELKSEECALKIANVMKNILRNTIFG